MVVRQEGKQHYQLSTINNQPAMRKYVRGGSTIRQRYRSQVEDEEKTLQ
jgi:hypothetical protein